MFIKIDSFLINPMNITYVEISGLSVICKFVGGSDMHVGRFSTKHELEKFINQLDDFVLHTNTRKVQSR